MPSVALRAQSRIGTRLSTGFSVKPSAPPRTRGARSGALVSNVLLRKSYTVARVRACSRKEPLHTAPEKSLSYTSLISMKMKRNLRNGKNTKNSGLCQPTTSLRVWREGARKCPRRGSSLERALYSLFNFLLLNTSRMLKHIVMRKKHQNNRTTINTVNQRRAAFQKNLFALCRSQTPFFLQ